MSEPRRKTLGSAEMLPMPPSKRRKSLATPRDSSASEASQSTPRITPHATLRQLAGLIRNPLTPRRPATNALGPATLRSAGRTARPLGESSNAGNVSRQMLPPSAKPSTPHTLRAIQRRNAALTPGRDRRRSGRLQRETPRDILRNLSRALAPISKPIEVSPQVARDVTQQQEDPLEQEPDLPRPRLSLPLENEEDGDDSQLDPAPQLSMPLDEDSVISKTIELGRRAVSEQPQSIFSRGSFGSIRVSDVGDLSKFSALSDGDIGDSILRPDIGGPDDYDVEEGENTTRIDRGGDTEDLRRHDLRLSFGEFPSIHSEPIAMGDEETFILDGAEELSRSLTTPRPEIQAVDETEDGVEDQVEEVDEDTDEELEDVTDDEAVASEAHNQQTLLSVLPAATQQKRANPRKEQKFSRHGIVLPSLPSGIVKKIATQFSRSNTRGKSKLGKDSLAALENATEWFFEQASEDLGAFAGHAGRKTIEESDVVALMKRQRLVGKKSTVFSLAQHYLPKELQQDVRVASLP